MGDDAKTPMTRAEYDEQIMRHSLEALKRSYRLLKEADVLLTSKHPQAGEPRSEHGLDEDPERSHD